jgi:uncharacterized protein (DUF58 family)
VIRAPIVPTRRLAWLLAATAAAWLLPGRFGVVAGVALATLVTIAALGDWLRAPSPSDLSVQRELPVTVGLGDTAEGAYEITSRWARPLDVTVYDETPAGAPRLRTTATGSGAADEAQPLEPAGRVALGATATERIPFRVVGRARGTHALGRIALGVAGPLGLLGRVLRYEVPGDVTIVPSLTGARRYGLLAAELRLRELGARTVRRRGEGMAFASLREYAAGDDPRRIDWKATARRGKPIVREYAVEQRQTVILAIDAGRLMTQLAAGDPPLPRFEFALSAASLLADVATRAGDNVGLLLFDDQVRTWLPPSGGAEALRRLRNALVPAQATLVEPDYAAAFRTLAAHQRRRALVVLFTDVIDARASSALVAYATRTTQRHLPLLVALRNDTLIRAALPTGDAPASAAFSAAAAEELLLARDEALVRMRQAGVDVLDVTPQGLTTAVINRYLEIKARGAL